MRVSFLPPRGSCVRARSKDAALLLFSLHPPPSHTRVRPPFAFTPPRRPFTRSYVLSFPLLLFISAYADYATVFSRTPPASSALSLRPRRRRRATFISGCDDNLMPRANKVFFEICAAAVESRAGVTPMVGQFGARAPLTEMIATRRQEISARPAFVDDKLGKSSQRQTRKRLGGYRFRCRRDGDAT